jgi:hypothetical protein
MCISRGAIPLFKPDQLEKYCKNEPYIWYS